MPSQTKAPGKGKTPNPGSSPKKKDQRAWRINPRALIGLSLIVFSVVALAIVAWFTQTRRGAPALLSQARKLVADKKDDLALAYLRGYLNENPKDVDALDLRSEILSRTARTPDQLEEAIRSGEAALRLDSSIESKRGQEIRRRLVTAYLAIGPLVSPDRRKYSVAESTAKELANATGSAADLRLHARALERTATIADPEPLTKTAEQLEKARKLEPKDVAGSEILAQLYIRLKDPAKAEAVLDDLLKANPTPQAYLAAARFYSTLAEEAQRSGRATEAPALRAKVEQKVAAAVAIAPHDVEVRVEAANLAIAAKKPAEAVQHLDQVEEKDRQNYRYLTCRGVVALLQNRANDAVDSWSRGLLNTGGTEAELSWRLAFVMLHLGRLDEGEQLIQQYRRLAGNPAGGSAASVPPEARYLEGLRLLKLNQPNKALAEFESARYTIPATLKAQFHLTAGAAYEATRNDYKALEEYAESIKADSKFASPRLARSRLHQIQGRLNDATAEIKDGLNEMGEDPSLLVAMARLELENQKRLPREKRTWKTLQNYLDRGAKVAPSAAALAIVRANAFSLMGSPEQANDLLQKATSIDKTDPDLWIARAEKEISLGEYDKALMVIDQAMDPKAAGDQASLRILKAKVLSVRGHGAEAREALIDQADRVPIDQRHRLWMALGELYMAQGDPQSMRAARQAFSEWARKLPDDPLPRLFVLELALSDPTETSADTIKESLEVLQKSGGLYDLVGRATYGLRQKPAAGKTETEAERTKRLDGAEALVEKIEQEYPQLRYGHLLRGELMQQRHQLSEAARAYEKALKAEGGRALALPRLVAVYNEMGAAGAADLQRLRAAIPEADRNIARAAAEAAARQGDKTRAEQLARDAIAGTEDSLDARIWYARLLNTMGKPAEAEKTLRELVQKHPENLGPWMALVYFQVSQKDEKGAIKTVESMMSSVKNLERPELVWAQAWRVVGERDRADAAFDAARLKWPDDPRVGRAAAEYYVATSRHEKADSIFKEALVRDPDLRWAIRGRALILSSRPGDQNAWKTSWELVKEPAAGGDLPEDRLIRAVVLSRAPDLANREASTAILAKLVEDLPADIPTAGLARKSLVENYLKSNPSKAADLAAVEANNPNASPAALSLHTSALIASKQLDVASRQLDRLNTLAPDDASTVTLRARLLRARGNGTEAATALEQDADAKINGPNGEALGRLIVQTLMIELDQPEAAERVARKLVAKYPKAKGVLAAVRARQGQREEALKLYLETINDGDPANVREAARNSLALITRDKFDPASIALAEKVIDAARIKDPKSSDLLAMAGYLRHFQNRYDDELKIYEEALAANPEDFTLMNNMAWTLSEGKKKPEEALERINQAFNKTVLPPAQFYDTRGCVYTRLGRLKEAIQDLELATRDRSTALIWAHLARAYKLAGLKEKFEEAKQRALNTTPPLTPDMIEPAERAELEALIFGK